MAKILLAGEILAEKQYFVDNLPAVKEAGMAKSVNYLTSSKIINAGRVLAVGNNVTMFGCIGKDTDGDNAIKDLQEYGINTNLVYRTSKAQTGQVLVLTNSKGQSGFVVHLSAVQYFDLSRLKSLSDYDFLYLASSMELSQLYGLIEQANANGVGVFLDVPNQQKELDKTKLKTVNFVVPNRQEAEKLLGVKIESIQDAMRAVTKLKRFTNGNAIITLDRDGAVVFANGWTKSRHFPTQKVEVVDETASGDIFRGVFLREYLAKKEIENSIKKALGLATKSTQYKGVSESILKIKKIL